MKTSIALLASALAVAAALSACGGGENSEPVSPVAGMWLGSTSSNRELMAFVLDNGDYWLLYSAKNNGSFPAGSLEGTATATNGNFISSNAKDFDIEESGIHDATISASYDSKRSLNGYINYATPSQVVSFTSSYSATYSLTPSLTTLAGTYSGGASVVGGTESAVVTISVKGGINGSSTGGCTFSGAATPRTDGNLYSISITFGGGVCSNATNSVTGIGYFDAPSQTLWMVTLNADRTNGLIFVGGKQ
jgi:hypothetical protein